MTMRVLLERLIGRELLIHPEFQSALIRLGVWGFMLVFLGAAGLGGYHQIDWRVYTFLFTTHLVWYAAILINVLRRRELSTWRRYLSVAADLSGTSLVVYLAGDPTSPYYLFYIWSFVSQGTRHGKRFLLAASIGSVCAYSIVVTLLNGWVQQGFEVLFLLLLLMVLPLYQFSLLRQLHTARVAAEQANQARGTFLANMTHELRTPLSGVIGMARLLHTTRLTDEQRDYVDSICSSANLLQGLVGDILDLSKIDARKINLKPVVFDLRTTLVEICSALGNQALDKGLELVARIDAPVPERVYGDDLRVRQILFNLVGNAVKFTARGHVCVQASYAPPDADLGMPHLRIQVRDTGIGIPAEQVGQIFEGFWQADSSPTREHGGTGLGTTIARDLTRLMGGRIGYQGNPGGGSLFWVKLPLVSARHAGLQAPQPPPALRGVQALLIEADAEARSALQDACRQGQMPYTAVASTDEVRLLLATAGGALSWDLLVLADTPQGQDLLGLAAQLRRILARPELPVVLLHYPRRPLVAFEPRIASLTKPFAAPALWQAAQLARGDTAPRAATARRSAVPLPSPAQAPLRVLVAEDDHINAKLIESLLAKSGNQVVLVRDGQAALDAAAAGGFDLALIDLRMPRLDGLGFTRQQRAREQGGRLPIIALTADAAEEARAECLAAGMDAFLTKPVDPTVLGKLLQQHASA